MPTHALSGIEAAVLSEVTSPRHRQWQISGTASPTLPGRLIPLQPMARFAKVNGSSLSNPVPIAICIIIFCFHISAVPFR